MLETQIIKTGRFEVMERNKIDRALQEKLLGMQGITDGGQTDLSGLKGVDYIVYGTITKFGAPKSATSIGGLSIADASIEMAADLRITDVHTGKFVFADTVEERAKSGSAFSIGGISTGSASGDAGADAARKMAKSLTSVIAQSIYPIKVVQVQGDGTIILNYGDSILSVKDNLKAFELGEVVKDPDTGDILGAEEKLIAVIEIKETLPKMSKASLVSGNITAGAIVRRMTAAESKAGSAKSKSGNNRKKL